MPFVPWRSIFAEATAGSRARIPEIDDRARVSRILRAGEEHEPHQDGDASEES